jgi:hypothetical protein
MSEAKEVVQAEQKQEEEPIYEPIVLEPMRCPNCKNIAYEPYDEYDHCGSYCASKGPNTTCWGCREDQPNQLAHMDKGGCLYRPPSSDEE